MWLCGVAALVLVLTLGASAAPASAGLVGDWKLAEGSGTQVADSSGAGNNGVLAGAATWLTGSVPGLEFAGTSGRVRVPQSSSLEPHSTVTVSAWVSHQGSPGDFRYIVAKGATGCIAAAYGLYTGPDGGIEFYISRSHGTVYERSDDGGTRIWDGKWHLVVGTFDGTTIRLYVDGIQVGAGVRYPGSLDYGQQNNNNLYLGNYPGCYQHGFVGDIAEVKVFNVALSAAQIKAAAGGGGTQSDPSPPTSGGGTGSSGTPSGSSGSAGGGSKKPSSGSAGAGSKKPNSGTARGGSTSSGTSRSTAAAPAVTRLRVSTKPASRKAHQATQAPTVTITYTVNRTGRVAFRMLRIAAGIRSRGRCVAPPAHPGRHAHSCQRTVALGRFTHAGKSGRISVRLPASLAKRLSAGRYELAATPSAGGRSGRTVTVKFSVPRPVQR